MDKLRLGIVGMGVMGNEHATAILRGNVPRCELAAVCDPIQANLDKVQGPEKFHDARKMFKSRKIDAVLIATPHYGHTVLGIQALKAGLHVIVEKPISVHKTDAEKLLAAHTDPQQVFAIMFNLRPAPKYQKVKQLVDEGVIGPIVRFNWTVTTWFRTFTYYASSAWRATWEGEGGGVLLNQCPHQLDILQWICGMPSRVTGFCKLGARHPIEVEDEVTAFLEYSSGATGLFITSTGEMPGTDRLEIAGDKGQIIVAGDQVTLRRNKIPASELCRTSLEKIPKPDTVDESWTLTGEGGGHATVLKNFTAAILDGAPLMSPASEGIKSLELANAMLYSGLINKGVDLPLNGKAYARKLKELIRESRLRRGVTA